MSLTTESPRPTVSSELIDYIQNSYGMKFISEPIHLGGSRNLNLRLVTKERKLVVRIYRSWITPQRLKAIQSARLALGVGGIPVPPLMKTLSGEFWTSHNDCLIEIEDYIEHDANMDTWERIKTGLPFLGRTHTILKAVKLDDQYKQPMIANYISSEEVLDVTTRGIDRIHSWDSTPEQLRFADVAKTLAHRLQSAEKVFAGKLPIQLVHGDFWDNNVFFRNEKVVLITDLDFMGERPRIDDLALTLYYTNSTFKDDQLSDSRIKRLKTLVDAYNSGLKEPL